MKVKFLGAARTVTGSCYLVTSGTTKFMIDCGLHQGSRAIEERNEASLNHYDIENLDFVIITHAHMDHSGLLPKLVKNGFEKPIYMTSATHDLLDVMLLDSAHIQEQEAIWENKKRSRRGEKKVLALYEEENALKTLNLLKSVEYEEKFSPVPNIEVRFLDAGHILGSAMVEIWVTEGSEKNKMLFSGDLGRTGQMIINNPTAVQEADFLFMESTYGDRNHKDANTSLQELVEAIHYAYKNGEKVIIPAFAVERTQELLFLLHQIWKKGDLPVDMPVFVDSPLAIKATEIFLRHIELYDEKSRALFSDGANPFEVPYLTYTRTAEESMAINSVNGPAIIISASGMMNAGRIKHHVRHNIWKAGAAIVFVGFQAIGTPGRKLVEGAKSIHLLGEELSVEAKIFTIGGFSSHAGQNNLLDWVSNFTNDKMKLFIMHGEYGIQQKFQKILREKYPWEIYIPDYLEECVLEKSQVVVHEHLEENKDEISLVNIVKESENKLTALEKKLANSDLSIEEQNELRSHLLSIASSLINLASELPLQKKDNKK